MKSKILLYMKNYILNEWTANIPVLPIISVKDSF